MSQGKVSTGAGCVLVVEDQPEMRKLLARRIEGAGYVVKAVGTAEEAIALLAREAVDLVCLDLHLPGMQGLEALKQIRARHRALPVVMLTADRDVETVVAAMQLGAFDYLPKPPDLDKLVSTIEKALDRRRHAELRAPTAETSGAARVIGTSPPIRALVQQIEQVAAKDITVLIHGESGTGKELVAHAIHEQSARKGGPFVAQNCAAIPESLQESEFFGHEKGAFTGAIAQRKGRFELADGGTMFLDEVAELTLPLQAKLLRVLQERRFQRVGGTAEVASDFRLVAATHRDLRDAVRTGKFREDLFFRIAVFELEVPALRERGDDVMRLAKLFGDHLSGGPPITFDREAEIALLAYPWPGNVRELQNAMQRALVLSNDGEIRLEHLPARVAATASSPEATPSVSLSPPNSGQGTKLDDLERKALEEALARTGRDVNEVARQLGIGRTTVYRKMKKFGLE